MDSPFVAFVELIIIANVSLFVFDRVLLFLGSFASKVGTVFGRDVR